VGLREERCGLERRASKQETEFSDVGMREERKRSLIYHMWVGEKRERSLMLAHSPSACELLTSHACHGLRCSQVWGVWCVACSVEGSHVWCASLGGGGVELQKLSFCTFTRSSGKI